MFSKAQCVESCRGKNFEFAVVNKADLSCNCMREANLALVNPFSCEDEDPHPFKVQ